MILEIILFVIILVMTGVIMFLTIMYIQKKNKLNELSSDIKPSNPANPSNPTNPTNLTNKIKIIGLNYKTTDKDISTIINSLKQMLYYAQLQGCSLSKDDFMKEKDASIALLKAKPVTCSEYTAEAKSSAQALAESIKANPELQGFDSDSFINKITSVWEAAAKQYCDDKGNVDVIKLDEFMTSVYNSFCNIPADYPSNDLDSMNNIGFSYIPSDNSKDIMAIVQDIITTTQTSGCSILKKLLQDQKSMILEYVKQQEQDCKKMTLITQAVINESIKSVQLPANIESKYIDQCTVIWNIIIAKSCKNNTLNPDLLYSFANDIVNSFCS